MVQTEKSERFSPDNQGMDTERYIVVAMRGRPHGGVSPTIRNPGRKLYEHNHKRNQRQSITNSEDKGSIAHRLSANAL